MADRVYHRTHGAAADAILAGGFKDGEGGYMTADLHRGVWVTHGRPWDLATGGIVDDGNAALIVVELPESVFVQHEWVQEGIGYREALVPADVLNRFPRWLAWECDGCDAVEPASSPGWTQETWTALGRDRLTTLCPACS